MLEYLFNIKKFIPDEYKTTIFDIDYNKLYENNKRLILTDLDNTLISYRTEEPTEELYKWKNTLENMGFEIIICSNNHNKRVKKFADMIGLKFVSSAHKPLLGGMKKALRLATRKYKKEEIIEIGDQLMTDQFASKRMGLYTIMVKNIDPKDEVWTTRFNRRLENKILKRIKKKYPLEYKNNLERYVSEKVGK